MRVGRVDDIRKSCKTWIEISDAYIALKKLANSSGRTHNDTGLLDAMTDWLTDNATNTRDVEAVLEVLSENNLTISRQEATIEKLSKLLNKKTE